MLGSLVFAILTQPLASYQVFEEMPLKVLDQKGNPHIKYQYTLYQIETSCSRANERNSCWCR